MEIRMAEIAELSIALLLILFAMVSKTQMFIHGNSQAFMPANNEVRWNIGIVDGMPVSMHKDVPTPPGRTPYLEDNSFYRSRSNIKFEPSLLDFQERHLGVPHGEKVTLINMNNNKTIHMSSISGNTVHFHCSFFEDKVIPPLGNTTFNVVFLGREEGKIHSTLFIHTSEGSFKYQVTGTGVMSPYRLRPLVGVRMPLNSSFTPLIHMHNPHTFPLQIVEVYSSGGELCLELPSGEMEGPKNLWEILPFETKPVIRAKFVGLSEKNHTVYIRIIVNSTMDYLVVPLEVEVGPQAGLYSPDDLIDFGLSGSTDAPKVAKLYLLNSGRKSIQIQNVISTPVSKAVKIDFKPIKVPPDSLIPTEVATVTFDSRAAFETKHFSGKIVAKGKQSGGGAQKVVVPYGARVLPGGLSLNASAAHFCTDQPPGSSNLPQPRNFTMTNSFAIPVAVHNVSLAEDHRKYFLIKHFVPVILDPGETSVLFQIGINEELVTANFTLESSLYLHTNVSKLCIPLLCYNGRLKKVILPTEAGSNTEDIGGEINFGLVGSGRKKDSYFAVVNENPVEIRLKSWGTNLSSTESGEAVLASVELAGVDSGNISSLLARHLFHNMTKSLVLKPHQYAVFKIAATAPSREGWLEGVAFVETQFERLSLAVKMRSAKGSLDVLRETLVFDECFPGKLCEQPLEVVSSFEVPMVAKSVVTHPPDARVTFFPASVDEGRKCGVGESKPSSSGTPTLPSICPHGTSLLGHLTFNPKAACGDHCYLGVSAAHKGGSAQWAQGAAIPVHSSSPNVTPPAALPSHIAESDSALVDILHSRFAALAGWQNVSLRLDTSEARRVAFKAAARLVWPRLLWWKGSKCTGSRKLCPPANSRQDIRFPLTHVANTSFLEVTLENPSDSPLLMQLALQYAYPQAKRVLDLLPRSLQPPPNEGEEATSSEEFRFAGLVPGPHWQWVGPGSGVGLPTNMPNGPSSNPASGGLLPLFLLQPKKSLTVQLTFKPLSPNLSSTLIFIRNNLTALEVVRVSGQGGYAQFRFGNRKPGNPSPLLFELTEKHLKDCERETPWKYSMPNLTVKRSFTARNTGDLPVFVTGLDIDGLQCEGYGFRILSCGPFEMPANGTHKVEIAFTPDFTLSKVQRVLRIHSGGGAAGSTISNYTMLASLPTYMLAPCSSVLPRPNWESRLYVAVLSFCVILFLIAIAAAFFESDRILKCTLVAMASSAAAAAAVSSPAANTCPPPIPPVNVVCSSHQAWTHPPSQQQNHTDGRKRDGQSSGRAMHAGTGWVGMTNRDRHEDDGMVRSGDISEVSLSSKGKKKLGRRNGGYKGMSHIGSTSVRVDRVDMAMSTSRSSEDTCLLEVPKESSKRGIGKGVSGKQQSSEGACSEEETCSTTTESSNNEEMEKSAFQENDLSSRQNKERSKSDSLISSSPLPSVITSTNHSKVPSPALPNSRSSSNGSSAPSPSSMSSSSASSSSSSSPPADFRDNYEGDCDEEDDYGGSRDHKTLGAALRAAERSCELSVTSQGTSNIGGVQKPKGAVAQASKATSYQKQSSSLEAAEGGKSRGGGDISRAATAAPSLELPYKPKPLKNVGRDRVKDGKGMSVVVTGKRRAADKAGTIPRGLNDMDHAITRPVPPPPQRQQTPPPPPSSSPHQIPSWDAHRMRGNNQSHPTDSPSPPILYSNVVSSYPLSLSGERQYPLLGPAVSRPSAIPATRGQLDRPEEVCARKKNQSRGRSEDGASNMSMPTVPMAPGGIPRGILGPIGRGPARPRLQASVPQVTPTLRLPPAWTTAVHSRPLSSQTATSSVQSLQSPPHDSHLFSDSFAKVPLQHESYASQVNSVGYVGDNLSCNTTGQGPIGTVGGASVLSGRNVWEQQSIMKVLQEERRKRVEEHQRINTLKDNWPGFDSQPSVSAPSATAESLWDPIYSPPSSIQSGLDKEVEQHLQKVNLQQSSAENHTDNPWTTFGDHGVWSSSVWMSSEGSAPHTPSSVEAPTQTHIGHHPPGLAPRAAVTLASVSSPPGLTLPPVTPLTSSSGFESLNHLITGSNRSPSMEAPLERAMDFDPFRSLGDIWSPRTMDSWSHNNNNNGNLQE